MKKRRAQKKRKKMAWQIEHIKEDGISVISLGRLGIGYCKKVKVWIINSVKNVSASIMPKRHIL